MILLNIKVPVIPYEQIQDLNNVEREFFFQKEIRKYNCRHDIEVCLRNGHKETLMEIHFPEIDFSLDIPFNQFIK